MSKACFDQIQWRNRVMIKKPCDPVIQLCYCVGFECIDYNLGSDEAQW